MATAIERNRGYLAFVIGASTVGSAIEWYDFYIFGSLAAILATHFFAKDHPVAALLNTIAIFTIGFLFRPLGAIVFGWYGDKIGRKRVFILTLLGMGLGTALIGVIPSYATIGVLAPILVFLLRVIQGLSVGGEWGGALTYVAEHAPDGKRGLYTGLLSPAAIYGLLMSFLVVLSVRTALGEETFRAWGWRIPFLLSLVLVLISLYVRLRLQETPMFAELKARRAVVKNPLKVTFTGENLRRVFIAAAVSFGQAVAWYTAIFWALFFLQTAQKLDLITTYKILLPGLILAPVLHVFMGWLSDSIGRKPIVLTGFALAIVGFYPLYTLLGRFAQKDNVQYWPAALTVIVMMLIPAMVWGPLPALLAEYFPTRVRYTSLGVVQNAANGWGGGLVPYVTTWIQTATGNLMWALVYPIALPLLGLIIGLLFLPETARHRLWEQPGPAMAAGDGE
ncbi:MFS transporter [Thermomicrobium sp. CFH 73360]|uniref:MFS transporter n=1 Tax=Thermomicrobium sp. CFH 73360 TaxID=2951987 RepID=UPI002076FBE6|nr:MFS transporter [Thermomicrobium sp. CFH 73360]MCM8747050.1 MFS transporter [Thermomicrobium sp. CFH 73360]MCM8747341.1 MFS transporter [Thermomicrobium sp. CFH 73360]